MRERIEQIGKHGIDLCCEIGIAGMFILRTVLRKPKWRQAVPLLVMEL